MDSVARCSWALGDPLLTAYHDAEWGVPCRDERALFERLMLEGMQAGLSWLLVLRKREALTARFAGWDIDTLASWTDIDIAAALNDAGIIRNQLKVNAVVKNARAWQAMRDEGIDVPAWLWSFVGDTPIVNRHEDESTVPALTDDAIAMSKALKKRGFTFVGPTICYSFMQSVGMVDDHILTCHMSNADRER